jgi:hypothetical protein
MQDRDRPAGRTGELAAERDPLAEADGFLGGVDRGLPLLDCGRG